MEVIFNQPSLVHVLFPGFHSNLLKGTLLWVTLLIGQVRSDDREVLRSLVPAFLWGFLKNGDKSLILQFSISFSTNFNIFVEKYLNFFVFKTKLASELLHQFVPMANFYGYSYCKTSL